MNKKNILASIMVATFILAACGPVGGTKIAYIDVQKVLRDSKSGKGLTSQIKTYGEKARKKVTPEQKRLEREQKRLESQRSTLSAAALQSKENDFRRKVENFQQRIKEENERLQAGAQDSLAEIESVLAQIYKEVSDKNGIDILLNNGAVLEGSDKADLTSAVVDILDERLPKVKLEVPKE